MKDTLSEVKNIYRETTVEWMKPRIKSVIWNIRKQKTTNQNSKKKKEFKKGQYKQPVGQLIALQHSHHRGTRRKRERARNWKSI